MSAWRDFEAELARRKPVFWLRDDDATAPNPELKRLLSLVNDLPLALAVIPDEAQPALFETLPENVSVLQHGCEHRNRAGPGEKKTEFPAHESVESALARLARSRERLRSLSRGRALDALVPPWNRIGRELAAELPRIGIRALSTYGEYQPLAGVLQVNTHVDIVHWQQEKRFIGDEQALRLAMNSIREGGTVGWLTHHAVHDEAAWDFLSRLLTLREARWASAAELFSYTRAAHG